MPKFYFFSLVLLACFFPLLSSANSIIYYENFSGTVSGITNGANGWSTSAANPSDHLKASGGNCRVTGNPVLGSATYTFTLANSISTVGYKNITLKWSARRSGNNATLQYSINGGSSFSNITGWTDTPGAWSVVTATLPVAAANVSNIQFRWSFVATALIMSSYYNIDDITLVGEPQDGLSTFKWSSRPTNENPFTASGATSDNPYVTDGVVMRWVKTSATGVNLTESVVDSRFQSKQALALIQNSASTTSGSVLSVSFDYILTDFAFTMFDVDRSSGQFQDIIEITGYLGNTPVNATKNKVQTTVNNEYTNSKIQGQASTADVPVTSPEGDVTYNFPSPIDRVQISYFNGDAAKGNQGIAISDMSWRKVTNFRDDPTTLPVTLISLAANLRNGLTKLTWATAYEQNNSHFIIERSHDSKHFSAIGQVKGNNNSITTQQYGFNDLQPLTGTAYYRLKQVDFNGVFEYSKIVSVKNQIELSHLIQVYPNPANAVIQIQYLGRTTSKLQITNLAGTVVKNIAAETSSLGQSISVADLPAGIYFVKMADTAYAAGVKFIKH